MSQPSKRIQRDSTKNARERPDVRFVQGALIAIISVMAFAACSAPQEDGGDSDGGDAAGAESEDGETAAGDSSEVCGAEGGTLTVGHNPFTSDWDLHSSSQGEVVEFSAPAFNGLVARNPDDPEGLEVVPDLAREWEVSDDGETYTFHLREDVTFHDGEPFTSSDVLATFDKIMDPPENVGSARAGLFDSVEAINAPDDYTVVFELGFADGAFMELLSMPWNVIYPEHILEEQGMDIMVDPGIEHRIGTGPFQYTDFDVNSSLRLERNPDYFKEGKPCLDAIEFRVFRENVGRVTAVIGGELDVYRSFAGVLTAEDAQLIRERADDVTVANVSPMHIWMSMYFNTERSPWDDGRVRQAVSEAVDRNVIAESAEQGASVGGLVLPGSQWELSEDELEEMPGYGPDMEERRDRARELLEEAGFTEDDPLQVNIMTRPGFDSLETAQRIQAMLGEIGAEVTLDPVEHGQQAERRGTGEFDVTVNFLPLLGVDPTFLFGTILLSDQPANQMNFSSPELDELWAEQRRASDPEERKELVDEMHKLALEESPIMALAWVDGLTAFHEDVKGFAPVAPQTGTWNSRHEQTWLDR